MHSILLLTKTVPAAEEPQALKRGALPAAAHLAPQLPGSAALPRIRQHTSARSQQECLENPSSAQHSTAAPAEPCQDYTARSGSLLLPAGKVAVPGVR